MKKGYTSLILVLALVITSSCSATYTISKDNLQGFLANTKPVTRAIEPTDTTKSIGTKECVTNGLTTIECFDGSEYKTLKVNPNTAVIIKDTTKNTTTFYLDTMFATDSTFYGSNSHIINTNYSVNFGEIQEIKIKEIKNALKYKE